MIHARVDVLSDCFTLAYSLSKAPRLVGIAPRAAGRVRIMPAMRHRAGVRLPSGPPAQARADDGREGGTPVDPFVA